MKKIIFIFNLFIVFIVNAQVNKATYTFKIADEAPKELQFIAIDINPLAESNPLYLYFSKNKSYYTSYNNEEKQSPDMSDAVAESYNPLFVNNETNEVLSYFDLDKRYVLKRENLPEWEITSESKNIGGYNCLKAIGKYKKSISSNEYLFIEAWFCPELPYAFGPKWLIGLPGLVVYAVDRNSFIYKLEKMEFNVDYNLDNIIFNGDVIDEYFMLEKLKEEGIGLK
nr:GLPGLI family protein [uncultured Flavobacterium sp.]